MQTPCSRCLSMVTFTVLHVAVGALTMAASVALAILVRRNIPAAAREFALSGPGIIKRNARV